jgi:phospholipid transport system substrate-binding protein
VEKAVVLLKETRHKPEATKDRREQIKQILFTRFDFSEMARRALGSHWRRRTANEQEEFVQLFTELLERQYADSIEILYRRENRLRGRKNRWLLC